MDSPINSQGSILNNLETSVLSYPVTFQMYISLNFLIKTIKIKELDGKKSLKNKSSFPLKFGQRCIFTAVLSLFFYWHFDLFFFLSHMHVLNQNQQIHIHYEIWIQALLQAYILFSHPWYLIKKVVKGKYKLSILIKNDKSKGGGKKKQLKLYNDLFKKFVQLKNIYIYPS